MNRRNDTPPPDYDDYDGGAGAPPPPPPPGANLVESPFQAQRQVAQTTGALATQSRELAETQTKYLMAERFPRDEVRAMDRIINAFSRSGLAERSQYAYARGGTDITGPSIHAAQAIAQGWGNIEMGWRELARGVGQDGKPYSEVEAFALDLQSRVPSRITFIVPHWRDTKQGGYKLKDERDIYELCANQAQRRKRACILSVVPQDVIDTAMQQASVTLNAKADTSPEGIQKLLDSFEPLGITKEHIEKRIQRRIEAITAAQIVGLKRIYASLRDDMSEPADWFDIAKEAPKADGLERVRAEAAAKRAGAGGKTPPATAAGQQQADPQTGEVAAPPPPAAGRGKPRAPAAPPPPDPSTPGLLDKPLSQLLADLEACSDVEQAQVGVLDIARHLGAEDYDKLLEAYRAKFPD
jgi:hypothetical protein